jgi:hypothetical protein
MIHRRTLFSALLAGGLTMAACGSGGEAAPLAAGAPPSADAPLESATSTTAGRPAPTFPPTTRPPESCPTPPGKYTQEQILAVRPQVQAMVEGNFLSVGNGANAVGVRLSPGREELAAQVLARFGDIVEIEVGETNYCGAPATSRRCDDVPGSDALPPGLSLTLRLKQASIRPTEDLSGELLIRNDSSTLFEMEPGKPLTANIVLPGTRTVVGTFSGGIAGTGYRVRLRNGETDRIGVIVGTTRCDGGVGSAIPPGQYAVRAGIGHNEGPPDYLAPEVPLTILAP